MPFLIDGPDDAFATILLAHGAGAPMHSDAMNAVTGALTAVGFRVARFEFGYMAARRHGTRKPPPKAELLQDEYRQAVAEHGCDGPLIIGGKSMGGRVASMIADALYEDGAIAGLLCLGYRAAARVRLRFARTAATVEHGFRDEAGARGRTIPTKSIVL